MVKKRFLYVNANKQANESDDGVNGFVRADVEDCQSKELSSEIVNENDHSHCADYDRRTGDYNYHRRSHQNYYTKRFCIYADESQYLNWPISDVRCQCVTRRHVAKWRSRSWRYWRSIFADVLKRWYVLVPLLNSPVNDRHNHRQLDHLAHYLRFLRELCYFSEHAANFHSENGRHPRHY